jgi:hypothetical protein
MDQIFVTNEPHMSCCGENIHNCKCGGHQAPADDGYVYSGRYSKFWTEEQEQERLREEQRVANERPKPMPQLEWVFQNEYAPKPSGPIPYAPANANQGLFAGAAFGEEPMRVDNSKPTPMPLLDWNFRSHAANER